MVLTFVDPWKKVARRLAGRLLKVASGELALTSADEKKVGTPGPVPGANSRTTSAVGHEPVASVLVLTIIDLQK